MERPGEPLRLFFANFELDLERRSLCRDGEDLRLPPKEYQVLAVLVRQAGRAVSKDELMAEAWPDTVVGDTSLARCISSLRRHVGAGAIQAVPKFGYRFALAVLTEPPGNHAAAAEWPPPTPAALPARRRLWLGLAGSAALLLVGAGWPLARIRSGSSGIWRDPQTGLIWQRQDNGVGRPRGGPDVTRDGAKAYCAALLLDGQHDWRLPTIEELQTLHDTAQSSAGLWGGYRPVYWHVKGAVTLSGGETASDLTWLTDLTPAGEEQSYDFSYGRRNYDPVDFEADHRALCVRGRR